MTIRAEVEGIGTLEFPDGTDPTVIQATVKRVVARGAPQIPSDTKIFSRRREPEEVPNPPALARVGRGFMDLAQGTKQGYLNLTDPAAAKEYTRSVDKEIADYNAGRGPNAGFDALRFGGNVLGAVPVAAALATAAPEAAAASLAGRMALGGVQGAVQGAAEFTPEGQSKGKQVVMGTAGGVTGPVLGELASRGIAKLVMAAQRGATRLTTSPDDIVRAIQGELQQAGVDWNKLGAEVRAGLVQNARRQLAVTGELSPDQIARKMEMEDVLGPGAGPTQAQVTRNPQQWSFERNTQKLQEGAPLTERYQAQAQRLKQRLEDAIAERQAKAQNEYQAGQNAIKGVQEKMDASKRAVDDLYATWRETGAGTTEVKPQRIADELGRVLDDFGVENIPGAVRARLESFGLLGGKQTKVLTIDEAEKLRRLIGNNAPNKGEPADRALAQLRKAVDDAVMDTDAPDIPSLKAARDAARARFSMRDSANAVTAAAEGVEPDRFFRKYVLNGEVRDLRGLKAALTTQAGGTAATESTQGAWRDLQAQTVRHIMEAATQKEGEFSGARLKDALRQIGEERLKVLFDPEQIAALQKLSRVASNATTEPPFAAVNHSNTAPTMMQYAGDVMRKVASIPGVKPFALPFLGAAEMGSQSLKSAQLRGRVAQSLTGEPIDPTGASQRYEKLLKLISDRMGPIAGGAAVGGSLGATQ